MDDTDLASFLDRVAADGVAFSEAKMPSLDLTERHVMVVEEGHIVAVGAWAPHVHDDGTSHVAVETVVERAMQFPAFETAVLDATLGLTDASQPVSVWSRRTSLDQALVESGFTPTRSLVFMTGPLPMPPPEHPDRPVRPDEWGTIVDINNAAYAGHREAATLSLEQARALMGTDGFDPDGVRIIDVDGVAGAFCWTKMHANGDGEIYRIAVLPSLQGRGLGRAAALAGYRWLANQEEVLRATLWVDEDNARAVRLYAQLGLTVAERNREFTRP